MKAITPVIALVMLMLVTVGMVGISYSWFGGLFSSQTKKAISIPPGGAFCSNGEIKVYALNNGDSAITASDILIAQVDGNDVKGTPFFGDMTSGLVGYWKFDETSGSVASDSSGNGNNGNLQPLCPNCPAWTNGRIKNALNFDGTDDFIVASNLAESNILFSAMAWIRTTASDQDFYLGRWDSGANQRAWAMGTSEVSFGGTGNRLQVTIGSVSGAAARVEGSTNINDNVWHHTAFTFNNGVFQMYVDGVTQDTTVITGSIPLSVHASTAPVTMGSVLTNGGWFVGYKGDMDEVKIYNKADADVNIPPSGSGMVINYPVLEGKHTVKIGTSSSVTEAGVTCA